MRINPITTQTTIARSNQRNVINNRKMTNPQISFKASAYEEEVEREVQSKRKNYGYWKWNWGGGEEKERQAAKAQQAEKVRNVEEIFRKMNEVNENKGFGRIAGYDKEKNILMQMVGSPIVLEKDGQHADVPNGILFFGPKGNGKTVFAESFAQQLDCNKNKSLSIKASNSDGKRIQFGSYCKINS